jgi:hypothetical protein
MEFSAMIKTLFSSILCSALAFAQWQAIPSSSYPTLDGILNGKLAFSTGSGAPAGNCVAGKDVYTRTNGELYWCTATNTWTRLAFLSSDLLTALNAKQGTLTLTTTGSGAATLVSNTLNIPTAAGGITNVATSASDPAGSCTNISTSNLSYHYNTAAHTWWVCLNSAWALIPASDPTASFLLTGNVGTAPGTPATGKVAIYSDSTQKGVSAKDDAGQVTRTVKPTDCSGTGHLQKINADGTVTCSADAGGSGGGTQTFVVSGEMGGSAMWYPPSSTTSYGPFAGGKVLGVIDEAYDQTPIAQTGTLKNACIRTYGTQDSGGSMVVTLRLNGADTAIVMTIAAGATAQTLCDTNPAHYVTLAGGTSAPDLLDWKVVQSTASSFITSISIQLEQ